MQPKTKLALWIVAALLFSCGISSQGLWNDEGFTSLLARLPPTEIIATMQKYLGPPLWYFVSKVPLAIFPSHPWTIRLTSLAATLASLALLLIGKWSHDSRAQGYAACIFSVSPLAHFYAHEGRNYALLGFLYLAAYACMREFLDRNSRPALALSALCCALMLYLHSYGVILVAAFQGVFFMTLLLQRNKTRWLPWASAAGASVLVYVPWMKNLIHQSERLGASGFLTQAWAGQNWITAPLHSLRNLIPGDAAADNLIAVAHLPYLPIVVSGLAATIFVGSKVWKTHTFSAPLQLLALVLVPLFMISLYSQCFSPTYVTGRTEAMVLPVFCLLLGSLLALAPHLLYRRAALSILMGAGVTALLAYHFSDAYPRKHWDEITAHRMFLEGSPPDLVVLGRDIRASIPAYLTAEYPALPVLLFPDVDAESPLPWSHRFLLLQLDKSRSRELVAAGLHLAEQEIRNIQPRKIAVIYPSPGQKNGQWVFPNDITMLIEHLKNTGYRSTQTPYIYPMDWTSGFHVLTLLEK